MWKNRRLQIPKSRLSLKKLHKYTPTSAKRTTIIRVFLELITIQTTPQQPKTLKNKKNPYPKKLN
jgi:hypothetical protein